jgi:molybdenum-dependent DNA-binding transcriptional regulator ModE
MIKKRRRATLRKIEVIRHFGSIRAAAREMDITMQYLRVMADPLPDQWAALAEVRSGYKLRAFGSRRQAAE